MRNIRILLLPLFLILLILLGILLWIKFPKFADFGLNFTTEIIGVFITVFVVDYLIKKREDDRMMPNRIIAYKETALLYNRFLSLVFELYNCTIKENPPKDTISFLKSDSLYKALYFADCNANAKVSPPQKLPNYIANCGKDLEERADKILDKYSIYLNPKVSNLIHKCFVENVFVSDLKFIPLTITSRKELPFPQSLAFHVFQMQNEDVNNLVELFTLLEKEWMKYKKIENEIRGLSDPEYIINQKDRKLVYRIEDKKLAEQTVKFNDWKKRSDNC